MVWGRLFFSILAVALHVSTTYPVSAQDNTLVQITNQTSRTITAYYATNDLIHTGADPFFLARNGGSLEARTWPVGFQFQTPIAPGGVAMVRVYPVIVTRYSTEDCFYMFGFVYSDESISYSNLQDLCISGYAFASIDVTQ